MGKNEIGVGGYPGEEAGAKKEEGNVKKSVKNMVCSFVRCFV